VFKLNKEYTKFEDIIFLTAMGPPGSGRNDITARIIRHFNIVSYADLEDSTIKKIFTKITSFYMGKFPAAYKEGMESMIDATIMIFNKVKQNL